MSPLPENKKKEVQLLSDRRMGVNSSGKKFYCMKGKKKLPFFVWENRLQEMLDKGYLVVPLPHEYVPFELESGWVRFYKKKSEEGES